MAKTILNFEIPEELPWRKQTDLSTSKKLEEIISFLGQPQEPEFKLTFAKCMMEEYIYDSNVSSSVGYQDPEKIRQLIISMCEAADINLDNDEKVTYNTEKAMEKMKEMKDNEETLTIEKIMEVHKIMMNDISCTDGKLRSDLTYENEVQVVRPDKSTHSYPNHRLVKHMLEGIMEQHNIHMANIPEGGLDAKLPYLIKSAAWLLARFVSIHPFTDGNGRMCRLLASHVLSHEIPFPVHVYKTAQIDRIHYINAIIECQDNNGDPKQLSAMLVDSIYDGFCKMNEKQKTPSKQQYILIPIQIRDKEEAWKKVKAVFTTATEEDKTKFDQEFDIPVTNNHEYRELILIDPKETHIEYIVRIFKP